MGIQVIYRWQNVDPSIPTTPLRGGCFNFCGQFFSSRLISQKTSFSILLQKGDKS